jgi:uncharacterized protein (DUF4415 family)
MLSFVITVCLKLSRNAAAPCLFFIEPFNKLPVELQNKIKYDIKVRVNFRDIAEKYKNEGIKYQTLLNWNKKKAITDYEGEIVLN